MMLTKNLPKIVVIGGGTGSFTVLSGLKKYPLNLTAIVAMADDGGSTGILRDELGVLPPGDVRQCLVALSSSDRLMRQLMNYRFPAGRLKGHSFGNLLLSALEKITGRFDSAINKVSEILALRGRVIPATLDKVQLVARLPNGKNIKGQSAVHKSCLHNLKELLLKPAARANPKALRAIHEADFIVVAPGDFYSSVMPNFLITGIRQAVYQSSAKKFFIGNLMTKKGHTDNFSINTFVEEIQKNIGADFMFDYVIFNNRRPRRKLLRRYAQKGEQLVGIKPQISDNTKTIFIGADLINQKIAPSKGPDLLKRTLIRHSPSRLARIITSLICHEQGPR